MLKHLKVEYNGIVLFDGDVEELQWHDGPNGVSVVGKAKRTASGAPVSDFLEKLVGASKQNTHAAVEDKRASYLAE